MSDLLKPLEVAELLRIEPRTLADWRYRGVGPRYLRLGQRELRYRRSDIERWLSSRERDNTAQDRLLQTA